LCGLRRFWLAWPTCGPSMARPRSHPGVSHAASDHWVMAHVWWRCPPRSVRSRGSQCSRPVRAGACVVPCWRARRWRLNPGGLQQVRAPPPARIRRSVRTAPVAAALSRGWFLTSPAWRKNSVQDSTNCYKTC
jgi:hypothetical protein